MFTWADTVHCRHRQRQGCCPFNTHTLASCSLLSGAQRCVDEAVTCWDWGCTCFPFMFYGKKYSTYIYIDRCTQYKYTVYCQCISVVYCIGPLHDSSVLLPVRMWAILGGFCCPFWTKSVPFLSSAGPPLLFVSLFLCACSPSSLSTPQL